MNIVSLKKCESYDVVLIEKLLLSAIEDLGGLEKYINKGEKVLLKINMLMKKSPEEATTTHPAFVMALAKILIDYGATVVIGDSPGGPFNVAILKNLYKHIGMQEVADKTGATLSYNVESFEKENPNGKILKKIVMTSMINDVDKIISVSKLKTHGMMTFTGATKNMFGTIPGVLKAEYHLNMPSYDRFADALVDICLAAAPVLSFMDGIVGMEGHGPSGGEPRNVNLILASDSPYQLDKVACKVIDLEYEKVPTIMSCINRGLCKNDLSDIELKGDDLNSFIIKDFKIPDTVTPNFTPENSPQFIKNFIGKHLQSRPVFNFEKCIACQVCINNCPAKVLTPNSERKPELELKGCIRCYCCQELCGEKAVEIYKPLLLRIVSKL